MSLARLLASGVVPDLVAGHCELELRDYTAEIVSGGFPGLRGGSDRAVRAALDGYLSAIALSPEPVPSEEWQPPIWGTPPRWDDDAERARHGVRLPRVNAMTISPGGLLRQIVRGFLPDRRAIIYG